MNLGTVGAGAFVGLVLYGLSCDLRRWLERRHLERLNAEMAEKERRADGLAEREQIRRLRERADAMRDEVDTFAELCAWFAPQAAEIAELPEVDPWQRWLP